MDDRGGGDVGGLDGGGGDIGGEVPKGVGGREDGAGGGAVGTAGGD